MYRSITTHVIAKIVCERYMDAGRWNAFQETFDYIADNPNATIEEIREWLLKKMDETHENK